jgi:hypothetical protein
VKVDDGDYEAGQVAYLALVELINLRLVSLPNEAVKARFDADGHRVDVDSETVEFYDASGTVALFTLESISGFTVDKTTSVSFGEVPRAAL